MSFFEDIKLARNRVREKDLKQKKLSRIMRTKPNPVATRLGEALADLEWLVDKMRGTPSSSPQKKNVRGVLQIVKDDALYIYRKIISSRAAKVLYEDGHEEEMTRQRNKEVHDNFMEHYFRK
jgi:hypothetical protein